VFVITRLLLAIPCVLLLLSLAAFFLFVPPMLIAVALGTTLVLLLTGYTLLYCFAVQPELRTAPTTARNDPKN
jgi:uncharacterized membrane protein